MPKFLALVNLEREALGRFIAKPEDRRGPVQTIAEAAGGKLLDYYWMFGQYDALAIFGFPDSATAAAVSFVLSSSGALSHVETHELIDGDQLVRIAEKAKSMQPNYRPPGS